ncbi:MAG TPA: hypothetical protein VHJ82_05340 [Actinomycetota bacterium]|nr:hypothetical protein [Actinomycetota bacterium]
MASTVGWIAGFLGPLFVAAALLYNWSRRYESWGFEYMLLIPVALLNLLAVAPTASSLLLRLRGHEDASTTARWEIVLGLAAALLAWVVPLLAPALLVALPAVPVVARGITLRRSRPALPS